jgi:Protein of unknown function (DUF4242)
MNQRLTLPDQRTTMTPVAVFLIGLAIVAALALGFALRTWTEDTSSTAAAPTVSVQHVEPTRAPEGGARQAAVAMTQTTTPQALVTETHTRPNHTHEKEHPMPKYVIERNLPGAGTMSSDELHAISSASNRVLVEMAPRAQWVHSYVTDDKLYCVYVAEDADAVREHATRGGFPADSISAVRSVIDPTTGEPASASIQAGKPGA